MRHLLLVILADGRNLGAVDKVILAVDSGVLLVLGHVVIVRLGYIELLFVRVVSLDKLRVERDGASRDARSEEHEHTEDAELSPSDVLQDLTSGDAPGDLLVDPFTQNGTEDSVQHDVGDVKLESGMRVAFQ